MSKVTRLCLEARKPYVFYSILAPHLHIAPVSFANRPESQKLRRKTKTKKNDGFLMLLSLNFLPFSILQRGVSTRAFFRKQQIFLTPHGNKLRPSKHDPVTYLVYPPWESIPQSPEGGVIPGRSRLVLNKTSASRFWPAMAFCASFRASIALRLRIICASFVRII